VRCTTRQCLGALTVSAVLAFLGCQGDSGSSEVDLSDVDCSFEPCGGDPVGRWTYAARCVLLVPDDCPDELMSAALAIDGRVTFRDDGTYEATWSASGIGFHSLPAACVPEGGCDELDSLSTDCRPAADGCDCDLEASPSAGEDYGYWEIFGGDAIQLEDSEGSDWFYSFCVEGDVMKIEQELALPGEYEALVFRR